MKLNITENTKVKVIHSSYYDDYEGEINKFMKENINSTIIDIVYKGFNTRLLLFIYYITP